MRFNLLIFLLVLASSCSNKKCNCDVDQGSLIQEYKTTNKTITLNKIEQGAFGEIIEVKICDTSNNLIEEIYIRGENSMPKLDSVIGNNIYISYIYPSSTQEDLNFEILFDNIVLGDGLLNKQNLKFKYLFSGKYIR